MLKIFEIIREKYRSYKSKCRARSLLREYYRKSYAQVCLYLRTNYLAPDAVDVYITHALPFIDVIEQYKKLLAEQEKFAAYAENNKLFSNENPLAEKFLIKSKEVLIMLQEERKTTENTPALTPTAVVSKNNKLAHLDAHIKNTEATIEAQEQLLAHIRPPKRKVGRPKGSKKEKFNVKNPQI